MRIREGLWTAKKTEHHSRVFAKKNSPVRSEAIFASLFVHFIERGETMDNQNVKQKVKISRKIKKSQLLKENKENQKDEYSILHYFKEHPVVLGTLGTGLIAVLTFFAKTLCVYCVQKQLTFWNFNLDSVSFENEHFLLKCFALIFMTLILSSFILLFEAIGKNYESVRLYRYKMKQYIKLKKKENKKKSRRKENTEKEAAKISEINNYLSKRFKKYYTTIISLVFLNSFLMCPLIYFCSSILSPYSKPFLVTLIYTIVLYCMLFWEQRIKKKRKIKKEVKKNVAEGLQVDGTKNQNFPKLPWKKLHLALNDKNIKIIVAVTVVSCVFLAMIWILSGIILESHTVPITIMEDTSYVVVYQDKNQYCLEEAKMDGDNLIVYTDKQRVLSTDDISYTQYTFEDYDREKKMITLLKNKKTESGGLNEKWISICKKLFRI